jgi:hypothetical protein
VFVTDDADAAESFQIWGVTKLAGNTSRYGFPHGQIDRAYLYLGSLGNFAAGEPTLNGTETYDKLSPALLEDAQAGIERSGEEPIVVVADIFNATGSNAEFAVTGAGAPADLEVWRIHEGAVITQNERTPGAGEPSEEPGGNLLVTIVLLPLLLIPGFIAYKGFLPDAELPEALGLVPALSAGLLALSGIVVLAVARAPFSSALVWIAFVLAAVLASLVGARSGAGLPFADLRRPRA